MMMRFTLAGLVAAAVLTVGIPPAQAQTLPGDETPNTCDGKTAEWHKFRANRILSREYRITYYSTHAQAKRKRIEDFQVHRRCLQNPKARNKLADKRHDDAKLQRQRIAATPYGGYGVYWAIPVYVASCESGGGGMPDYTPVGAYPTGGAYGLLDAWALFGGKAYASTATQAAPIWQDLVANAAWNGLNHEQAWACA